MGIARVPVLYSTPTKHQPQLAIRHNHRIVKQAIYPVNTAPSKVRREPAITPIPTSV